MKIKTEQKLRKTGRRAAALLSLLLVLLLGVTNVFAVSPDEGTALSATDVSIIEVSQIGQEAATEDDSREAASEDDSREAATEDDSRTAATEDDSREAATEDDSRTAASDGSNKEEQDSKRDHLTREYEMEAREILQGLSLEEKVCQLFVITPEALTGYDTVTAAGESTREAIENTPVAGLIYFSSNLQDREQITTMLSNTQEYSIARIGLPMLLAVDEEGGTVRRINGRGITQDAEIPSMREVGAYGDTSMALGIGMEMGSYLSSLGFNVDFAPVADVLTNPDNTVVADRSFGSDPELTARLAAAIAEGLKEYGVAATFKHFPGHGSTGEDSHSGYACSWKNEEELFSSDLIPFQAGVDIGVGLIMAGHISLPEVTGDMMPASLNRYMVTDLLREKMGYQGVVITDALNMGAVTENYNSADAAVLALQAGCDLLLMPADWYSARRGVMSAVEEGILTEERIDESVLRVIKLKKQLEDHSEN